MIENRNYKDRLFVHMFGECENAKKYFLELYNALHDTNLKLEDTKIENVTLKDTVYVGEENDVSMLINDRLVVLAEHQSTINNNMPLRCLEYVVKIYQQFYSDEDKYRKKLISLPAPEFYVFYNGSEAFPVESELKLSSSFKLSDSRNLDLTVKVCNINLEEGHRILEKCRAMHAYSRFVYEAQKAKANGKQDFLTEALKILQKTTELPDFFPKLKTQELPMIFGKYDYETDLRIQTEEAIETTHEKDAENALKLNLSFESISKITGLSIEKIQQLKENLEVSKN